MSNDLMTTQPVFDGWANLPASDTAFIIGTRIKFSQGDYTTANGAAVSPSERFGVTGVALAWQRWQDAKAETRITGPGELHPRREDLGDNDPDHWPLNRDGEREDPWSDCRAVYLLGEAAGAEFTFVTASWGVRKAVAELGRLIQRMRNRFPAAVPIVTLGFEKMPTKRGTALKPVLAVAEWHGVDVPPASISVQMSDDIPF